MKKVIITSLIIVMVLSLGTAWALKTEEGEKLTGKHYTLNIIGVPHDKKADMEESNRHTIFVPLDTQGIPDTKSVKIMLIQDEVEPYEFQVLDGSATQGDPAEFQLPAPDPDNDGVTEYSVYARELGTPGGKATMKTCAEDEEDTVYCSYYVLELERSKGKPRTRNVSKELLYIYADIDDDGVFERVPLFDPRLEDYYWEYNNQGLKLLQLRFYPTETTVPGVLTSITPSAALRGVINLPVMIASVDPLVDFTGVQKNDVDFGPDITVNSAVVVNPALLGVTISIALTADPGERIVTVEIGGVLYPIYFEVL